jgi:hypothetical protein
MSLLDKRRHLWIGLAGLVVFQTTLFLKIEPVATYFYSLIWWSYILVVDGLIFTIQGHSWLVNRTRQFFLLIPWSVFIWLIFEAFNLALKNWYYIGVPEPAYLRWPGYFVAYGTVLPALFETKDLLAALGLFKKSRLRPVLIRPAWFRLLIVIGALCLILPLAAPSFFFPLVWLGFIFLLEPFNYQTRRSSLLRDLEQGKLDNLLQLPIAGMICGLLWEFWNYWAGARWVYTVPWVGDLKLFEMPILGFFGFPPFALECYVMVAALGFLEGHRKVTRRSPWGFWPVWLFFYLVMFSAVDRYTVRAFG